MVRRPRNYTICCSVFLSEKTVDSLDDILDALNCDSLRVVSRAGLMREMIDEKLSRVDGRIKAPKTGYMRKFVRIVRTLTKGDRK